MVEVVVLLLSADLESFFLSKFDLFFLSVREVLPQEGHFNFHGFGWDQIVDDDIFAIRILKVVKVHHVLDSGARLARHLDLTLFDLLDTVDLSGHKKLQ